jgi:hypothetical protein
MNPKEFIGPECGSSEAGQQIFRTMIPTEGDPWSEVLMVYECGWCRMTIPGHLAERRDGMTLEAAQKEWREVHRGARR